MQYAAAYNSTDIIERFDRTADRILADTLTLHENYCCKYKKKPIHSCILSL